MFAGRSTSSPSASSSSSFSVVTVVALLSCTFLIVVDIEHVTCMSLDRLAIDRNEIQNFEQQLHEQQQQQQQEDYNSNSNVLVEDMELELPAAPANNYGGDTEMYVLLPAGSVSELESVDKNTIENVEGQDLQEEHNEEEESLNMVENSSDMLMVETNEAPAMVEAVEMPLPEDENKSETTQIELEQADEVMPGQEPVDSTTPLALMMSETAQQVSEEIPAEEKPVANEMELEIAGAPEMINEAITDAEIQPEAEIESAIATETQKDEIEMETEPETVEESQSVDESESQNLVQPEALADTIEEVEKEIEEKLVASEDLENTEAIHTNEDIQKVEETLPATAEESENVADSETQEDSEAASATENVKESEMEAIDSLTSAIEEMLPVEATENVSQLETEVATNEEEDVQPEPAATAVATNEEDTQEQAAEETLVQSEADTSETEQLAETSETETVAQLLADEIETVKEEEEAMTEEKLEEEAAKEPAVEPLEDNKLEATEEVKEEEQIQMESEAEPIKEEAEINMEPVMVSQNEEVHEEIQTADEKPQETTTDEKQEEPMQIQEAEKEIIAEEAEKVEEVPAVIEVIEEAVNEKPQEVLPAQDEEHKIETVQMEIESQSHQTEEETVNEDTPKEEVVAEEDTPKEETPAVEAEPETAPVEESQKEETAAEVTEPETTSVAQDEPQKEETAAVETEPETASVVQDEPQIIEEQQPAATQEEQKPAESVHQDEEVQPETIVSEAIAEPIKPEIVQQNAIVESDPAIAIETEMETKPEPITEDKQEPAIISTQEHIAEEPQKTEAIETSSMLATIIQVPQMQTQEPQQVQQIQIAATEEAAMPTKLENETPAQIPQQQQQAQTTQTVEAIEHSSGSSSSSTQKPLNVVDSVLNYVNASFVQQNNNRPHQQHPQDVEMFSSKLRRYDGAQVWRIVVQNDRDKKLADELQTKYDGQLWKEVKQEVDYLLKPQVLADAARHIRAANLSRIVLIDNLQKVIEVENPTAAEIAQLQNRKGHRLTWQAYHRLEDIHGFFDFLAKTYPDICSVETIGHSVQKRPLKILKISNGNAGNPGVWIDGGMHAREWISPASVTYIANQIVEGWDDLPAYMKNVNWYIHAVANPDGYEYSHTTDRLWRKNMRAHGRQCPGVDLNRNFGYKWGGKGTSANPCSQTYRGSKAFSEPETFYISKFISNFPRETFQAYLSFHSYGQYILYPWGYDYHLTNDRSDLDRVARQAGTTITRSSGVKYTVGSSATTLYPAAGGSDDWAKGIAGIKYSYTIEMGDTGRYGFVLPASFIETNGRDGYTFVETVARAVTNTKDSRKRAF